MVALVRIRRRSLVGTAYNVLTGRPRGAMLYAHDADRIEIVCDRPMPLHVDGEDLGDVNAATFEAERGAVTVLA
jgi:diacylglycerol kinase family enzyme